MAGSPNSSFGQSRKLAQAKAREFSVVDEFKLGYRNREDVTKLPAGVLIVGSQNVLSNVSDRLQIRQGYALDGATSAVATAIASSFDWVTRGNDEKHLRSGFLTSNDGKLQYRYVDSSGAVTWRDLLTGLSNINYNFTTFWNTSEQLREALFVNGQSQIQAWNGATAEVLAVTPNSITKTGTVSWLNAGFYAVNPANKNIVINGNTYAYTGGETTTTLTGVTPSPILEPIGSVVHQAVVTTLNSAMTGINTSLKNGLIKVLNNQVFVAALDSPEVFISKVNSYIDYSFSTPRQTGEGWSLILDSNVVAFEPQEEYMYVSAGLDRWYNVNFQLQTSTVGVTYEQVNAKPLKTGARQGAQSQAFVSHMKNNIIVVTNEPTIDTFGRVEDSLATPQTTNISDPIKLDVDSYDFTGGSIYYFQYDILVAIPAEGIVLVYDLNTKSWEAPQTLPISRFYTVNGELYGHSSQTSESYKLFTGYADRVYPGFTGSPIDAKWIFSYQSYGARTTYKKADALYIEGYINANTTLKAMITYELDGCATTKTFSVSGSDAQIVCLPSESGSFGKESFGKKKLGGAGNTSINGLPPKFRVEKGFTNTDFFEVSISFEVSGTDNRAEILGFGLNAGASSQEPVRIRQ